MGRRTIRPPSTTVLPTRQQSAKYRRRMTYRDIAANETGIRNQVLERAQYQGLVLAVDEDSEDEMDEIEIIRQVKLIRAMAVPLIKKRYLRYDSSHVTVLSDDLNLFHPF